MTIKMMSKAFLVGTGLFFAAHTAHADPADLDTTTFSGDGRVISSFGSGNTGVRAYAVKVQSDGKIVTVGEHDGDWAIARHTSAGALDTSFNSDGKVTTNYGGFDQARALDFQSDGKIVAVGDGQAGAYLCVTRYLTNGTHDTTFSGDGKVGLNFGFTYARAYGVAIQSDGKIVVVGTDYSDTRTSNSTNFLIARFLTDGSLDTTFSSDGWTEVNLGGNNTENLAAGVALQSDGKIVIAGTIHRTPDTTSTRFDVAVARYNTDGTRDTTFSSDGLATYDLGANEDGVGLVIQSNGKIVVGCDHYVTGGSTRDFGAIRINSNGALDTSFSGDGMVTTASGFDNTEVYGIALQSDGKIVMSGGGDVPADNGRDFILVRYTSSGALDTTFSGDGIAYTNFSPEPSTTNPYNDDVSYAVTIQSDGKIVAAGNSSDFTNIGVALARYIGTPVSPIIAPRNSQPTSPAPSTHSS